MASALMPAHSYKRLMLAGGVIGFALGGFFDGILLHQVLQWHHLFSLVPGEAWRDLYNQILMDGLFHVLHYAIALLGLWLLWRSRAELGGLGSGVRLLGVGLLGFSLWQFVDTVVFHWVLMIHRIRVGVENPLAYDLGWLVVFGVTSLAAGLWLWRRGGAGGGTGAAAALAALVLVAGPVASMPPRAGGPVTVLFHPGMDPVDAFAAVAGIGGRVLWADAAGRLLTIDAAAAPRAWQLYGRGALLVSGTAALGGCLNWARS